MIFQVAYKWTIIVPMKVQGDYRTKDALDSLTVVAGGVTVHGGSGKWWFDSDFVDEAVAVYQWADPQGKVTDEDIMYVVRAMKLAGETEVYVERKHIDVRID